MTVSGGASKRVSRLLAGLLLIAGLGTGGLLLVLGERDRAAFLLPVLLAGTGAAGWLAPRQWPAKLSLLVIGGTAGLYLGESATELSDWSAQRRERLAKLRYASDRGERYDFRTQGEFLRELRSRGIDANPAFPGGQLLQSVSGCWESVLRGADGQELLPLGSISSTDTVYGNESGKFLVYRSDRHGFNNPGDVWTQDMISVAVVGDSYAHGASVPPGRNLVAPLRRRWPRTLNLGHGGNGPFSELASILEYLPEKRPEVVLWMYCDSNDLTSDLEREKHTGRLRRYLEDGTDIQGLAGRQAEIDRGLRKIVRERLPAEAVRPHAGPRLGHWLGLRGIRLELLRLRHQPVADYETFERVLAAARQSVAAWGGKLVFVNLPMKYGWPGMDEAPSVITPTEKGALSICRELGIPVIDLKGQLIAEKARYLDYYYPFRAHFTADGYGRIGERLARELIRRGLLDSP